MTQALLRKRDHEPEALDSIDAREPKRFHGEEAEEEFATTEELVNRMMRSLEEEIAATCFSSFPFSNSGVNSAASNIYEDNEDQTVASDSGFDLCYLLEASDDELGVPQNTVQTTSSAFHGEETEEELAPTAELVNRMMRSLEEEIAATCFSSFPFSNSWVNSAASNIYEDNEDQTVASDSGFDLCYLLEASDSGFDLCYLLEASEHRSGLEKDELLQVVSDPPLRKGRFEAESSFPTVLKNGFLT